MHPCVAEPASGTPTTTTKHTPNPNVELLVTNTNNTFAIADTTFQYSKERPPGTDAYDDWFVNDKKKIGINIKYGWHTDITSNLHIECYFGLGVALRKSVHTGRENLKDEFAYSEMAYFDREGTQYVFSLPLNVKFGYRF